MLLSIPALFSRRQLEQLETWAADGSELARVDSVYGSLPRSLVGHARPPDRIPEVSPEVLDRHLEDLRRLGIRMHYTLNAPWSGGADGRPDALATIRDEAGRLLELGVDGFVLANPYLIHRFRTWFPTATLLASINLGVASVLGVEQILELGADRVTVDRIVLRSPPLLRTLGRRFGPGVSVLVNSPCLLDCPMQGHHALVCGHLSRGDPGGPEVIAMDPAWESFSTDWCLDRRLDDPAALLRSPWVRPEDLDSLSEAGLVHAKLQGRTLADGDLGTLVQAYLDGETPGGDLMGLFPGLAGALTARHQVTGRCGPIPFQRLPMAPLADAGFFEQLRTRDLDCRRGCETCRLCDQALERAFASMGGQP